MKISELFNDYQTLVKTTENVEKVFSDSGMKNRFNELDFGFFPLGSGILKQDIKREGAEIKACRIMVLGNDFGTKVYLENECVGGNESPKNPTIRNLLSGLQLDPESTFFTNIHLGLRIDGTNTKRIAPLKDEYKRFCFDFFKTQLRRINPQIILCLGQEVKSALSGYLSEFNVWKGLGSIQDIYRKKQHVIHISSNGIKHKFMLIPHPSYMINLKKYIPIISSELQTVKNTNTNQPINLL